MSSIFMEVYSQEKLQPVCSKGTENRISRIFLFHIEGFLFYKLFRKESIYSGQPLNGMFLESHCKNKLTMFPRVGSTYNWRVYSCLTPHGQRIWSRSTCWPTAALSINIKILTILLILNLKSCYIDSWTQCQITPNSKSPMHY